MDRSKGRKKMEKIESTFILSLVGEVEKKARDAMSPVLSLAMREREEEYISADVAEIIMAVGDYRYQLSELVTVLSVGIVDLALRKQGDGYLVVTIPRCAQHVGEVLVDQEVDELDKSFAEEIGEAVKKLGGSVEFKGGIASFQVDDHNTYTVKYEE